MKALRSSRPRGGILVFTLMCSAVAVLGLTCWIMAVAGRSRYVDTLQSGTKRRLARDNGRVIAARYMNARVLPAAAGSAFSRGLGTYYSGLDNYEWGGVRMDAAWNGSPLASATASTGINRLSYGDRNGFGLKDGTGAGYDIPLGILDGEQPWNYRWQARSFSPVLAGDLLVVHNPVSSSTTITLAGSMDVMGRAYFHNASLSGTLGTGVTFRAYSSPGQGWGSLQATNMMVTNYPPLYTLAWAVPGTAATGVSNVIWDTTSPGNSLRNKVLDSRTIPALYTVNGGTVSVSSNGYSSDGSGKVTIDLNNPTLDGVVVENVENIDFIGQATATTWGDVLNYPTVLVVVHRAPGDTYTPTKFEFINKNNRRLALGVRCETEPPMVQLRFVDANKNTAGVGPEWRMVLMLEQTPVDIFANGSKLNLTGGIITDRSITSMSSANSLTIYRDVNFAGLSTKTARRTWVEGFRMD